MSITLYFGKVNIVSEHIYKVYSGEMEIRNILQNILIYFKDGMIYKEESSFIGEDGEVHTKSTEYQIYIKEKTDNFIRGRLDKTSLLYYKEENPDTRELEARSIKNTEANEFYFDVFNEMVGYNTSIRFGHKKFREIFEVMLNEAMVKAELDFRFSVAAYTEGIDIENLYRELKKIKSIQSLNFVFRPANPDSEILESIQRNGLDKLEEFEEANLATKSILFTSSSKLGLNVDSKIIKDQLDEAGELQRKVTLKKATSNGYVKVEATGIDGINKSTEEHAPIKRKISKMAEFRKACAEVIDKRNMRSIDDGE